MIKCNVEDLIKDLEKLHKDVTRRLEQMVRGFTYEFALIAIEKTPLGDYGKYQSLYDRRLTNDSGLLNKAGLARGSWQVPDSVSGALDFQELYLGSDAANVVQTHMMNYKLGETITLGNTGPYIGYLEGGSSVVQAPDGILKPTIDQMLSTYKIDLIRHYQQN